MSDERSILWRLFYGLLGGGLTGVALIGFDLGLAPAVVAAIAVGVAVLVALVGPKLFDLLMALW